MASSKRAIIVAVDGPAGSGKSSICKSICTKLGLTYINTGALYRAIGVLASRAAIASSDEQALCELVVRFEQHYRWDPLSGELFFQEENLSSQLGQEAAGKFASAIACLPLVRAKLLPLQRQLALKAPVGALLDGRDIGTVVFPDADVKIFMTATLEERARRRLFQLQKDKPVAPVPPLAEMIRDIAKRDEQDSQREVAPLKQATDAIVFDNSQVSLEEAVVSLVQIIREKICSGGEGSIAPQTPSP